MQNTPSVLMTFLLVALVAGCGGDQRSQSSPDGGQWVISAGPTVLIGGADEREDYLLHIVVGATRLSDGRIAIANGGSSEILFYDSLGNHLMTVGGAGEGPGEFRGLMQIQRLPGDTLLVFSSRPGLTWLSPHGDYLRSERVNRNQVASLPCRISEGNWQLLRDGSLLTVLEDNFGGGGCPPSPEAAWRMSGLIARSTRYNGLFDTLAILPATERKSPNYRVFGRSLVLAFGPDRIFAGDTGAEEILVLGFNGDTLRVLPTPFEPVSVPDEAKAVETRRFTRPDGSEQIGNPYDYPGTYPRFGRLLADEVGDLWVMAYPRLLEPTSSYRLARAYGFLVEEGGALWRVLGGDGQVSAEVRTPPGLFPLEIGEDYILGLSKDEYDVEAVQLHVLAR